MAVRMSLAEVLRVAEAAYRHEAWLDFHGEQSPDQFADGVVGQFEALMAEASERAGHPFRCVGYGATVAAWAAKVPSLWRPGWPWHGREQTPD